MVQVLGKQVLVFWNGKMMDRNYNQETENNLEREYFYGFDVDVMHPFIFETFTPHFRNGNILEIGSFEGDFTSHLLKRFESVDCIEASSKARTNLKNKHGKAVNIFAGTLEELKLEKRYDNIILAHVLEHLDHQVHALAKIKNEWLAPKGRLFIVVPNANAPSRQIAVRMGLVSHNSAVTQGEVKHGHRITYSFDTLFRDVTASGLIPVLSDGIFFKALANFQWDRLLKTDIVSPEYLRGCYELGKVYPDLCSSIFVLCEH